MKTEITYAGTIVRAHDKDRFFLSLKGKGEQRSALWALYALNHEIAKTREVVTETTIGLIRLQWWRDAIEAIYSGGNVPQHQILDDLAPAIKKYDLPKSEFETLIYSREFDLEDVVPASIDGVFNYADNVETPLSALSLRILEHNEEAKAIKQISQNFAIARLLRIIPIHVAQRRCFLPADLMAKHKVREGKLYDKGYQEGVNDIVRAMIDAFHDYSPPQSGYLKTLSNMARLYRRQIVKCDYNPFDPRLQVFPMFFYLRV